MLGEGGMGVVYGAHDDQLGRRVAIKTIRDDTSDAGSRDRLWREARAAASVNHPNICHVYEVGTDGDTIYLVMEWLEGEPLANRIGRSAMDLREALPISEGILAALEALHAKGIVHRDLKPANVFLTPHGVKLLDFGLARGRNSGPTMVDLRVTQPGMVPGTPRYMAPEQLQGQDATPLSDIFAFGAVLFEMLSGEPPFPGATIWEAVHAVLHDPPKALTGGQGSAAVNGIIHRCLSKRPDDRPPDAPTVARELRAAASFQDSSTTTPMRSVTRLMVLPFKMLRPDPEVDFLGFSLPDALIASLTGLGPLVVRSSGMAQRFSAEPLDLRRIAHEGQVDAVVTGTLLRAGDRLRLVAQLVEAPDGAVLWSKTAQVKVGDIFEVQDDLARQIVESLAIPITTLGRGLLGRDVPASGHAYELYLRANHLAHGTSEPSRLLAARELYSACLAEDPNFAPAWARIARIHRVLAKYGARPDPEGQARARKAFDRAFALNPDLPLAHHFYTYAEIESGQSEEAVKRLLKQVRRTPNDADLYAGLVSACRFSGLLLESAAADERARQLDPMIRTSVEYTWGLLQDEDKIRRFDDSVRPYVLLTYLFQAGRAEEGRAVLTRVAEVDSMDYAFIRAGEGAWEKNPEPVHEAVREMRRSGFRDPEGWVYVALMLAWVGDLEAAEEMVDEIVSAGYSVPQMKDQPWIAPLHGRPRFEAAMARASAARDRAAATFASNDGRRLLGMV